jgi:hypothetical protein
LRAPANRYHEIATSVIWKETRRRGEENRIPCRVPCEVVDVSLSGYFVWKYRPASDRQRKDMAPLAQIGARFRLSLETY